MLVAQDKVLSHVNNLAIFKTSIGAGIDHEPVCLITTETKTDSTLVGKIRMGVISSFIQNDL